MKLARATHASAVLDRILAQPALVQAVRELEPEALHALIRHVGLEDCGELVALASRTQIEQVFDADLWRDTSTGSRFDAKRFALWLELLVEQGTRLATDRVCELDEDLLVMALSKLVLVIDIESLAVRMANRRDDARDQLEKRLDSARSHELEHYRVIALDAGAFESVMAVLLELDQRDYAMLERLLRRCCALAERKLEDQGGLHQVLSAAETAEEDAAQGREDRREQAGYVPKSAAVAFLKLARDTPLTQLLGEREVDPITKSHLRTVRSQLRPTPSADHDRLLEVLQETRVVRKKLPSLGSGTPLRNELAALAERDPALHHQRMLELAYLANVLVSANGMRPVEAAERALACCERGARQLDLRTDLIKLFRVGFHLDCK